MGRAEGLSGVRWKTHRFLQSPFGDKAAVLLPPSLLFHSLSTTSSRMPSRSAVPSCPLPRCFLRRRSRSLRGSTRLRPPPPRSLFLPIRLSPMKSSLSPPHSAIPKRSLTKEGKRTPRKGLEKAWRRPSPPRLGTVPKLPLRVAAFVLELLPLSLPARLLYLPFPWTPDLCHPSRRPPMSPMPLFRSPSLLFRSPSRIPFRPLHRLCVPRPFPSLGIPTQRSALLLPIDA